MIEDRFRRAQALRADQRLIATCSVHRVTRREGICQQLDQRWIGAHLSAAILDAPRVGQQPIYAIRDQRFNVVRWYSPDWSLIASGVRATCTVIVGPAARR